MEGIVDIFGFCAYFGTMILCAVLIIYSVLRWIRHSETRDRRLYILSGIAFVILLLMVSGYYIKHSEGSYEDETGNGTVEIALFSQVQDSSGTIAFSRVTDECVAIIKTVVGLLIFVVVFASAVTLLFIVILFIYNGLWTIIQAIRKTKKPETKKPETKKPETKKPETEKPETEKPETEKPETEKPETEKSETEKSETGKPEAEKSETGKPETEKPETGKPEAEKSETGKPITEKPIDEKFLNVIKKPAVILVLTLGILSFFFILPILVGESSGGDLIKNWTDGVNKINDLFDFNITETDNGGTGTTNQDGNNGTNTANQSGNNGTSTTNQSGNNGTSITNQDDNNGADTTDQNKKAVITYILTYIIVLGVGFAVVKLLYTVLASEMLKKEKLDLIGKYSSPIALLSVGVAFLLALQGGKIPGETGSQTIWELVKAFGTVVFIIAVVILTLEIVRLLMDIRQKLIRQEAKYLFISLVGQSALLLLGALNTIYSAVYGMIDVAEDTYLDEVEAKLRRMIVKKMEKQIDRVDVDIDDDDGYDENYRTSFSGFDEKVTKK